MSPAWQGSITLEPVSRLKDRYGDPVYKRRAQQFAADAVLAAAAFGLAFELRFLDVPIGIPHRYWTMLAGSIAFVAIGKAIVFEVLGLHRKWWRYFQLPDLWPVVRAVGGGEHASSSRSSRWRSRTTTTFLARSSSSTCCSPILLVGGARLARRMIAERPDKATRGAGRVACSSSGRAPAARWSFASSG